MNDQEIQNGTPNVEGANEASKPPQMQPVKVKQRGKLGENRTETISLNQQNLQMLNSILGTLPEDSGIDNASKLFVYFMDSYLSIATIQANSKALQQQLKGLHENSSKQQEQINQLLSEREELSKKIKHLSAKPENVETKPEVEKTKTIPPVKQTSCVDILYPGING